VDLPIAERKLKKVPFWTLPVPEFRVGKICRISLPPLSEKRSQCNFSLGTDAGPTIYISGPKYYMVINVAEPLVGPNRQVYY